MAEDGFTFEYSATFKQALAGKKTKKEDRETVEDYQKAIIFDYSYKHFYNDGYGKDYRIYNLKNAAINEESRLLYLTGCLLSFYQQKKCFAEYRTELVPFRIENPLLVFVGNSVTKVNKDEDLSDVEDVIMFIDQFVRNKRQTIHRIDLVVQQNTGLIDAKGVDIFSHDFNMLYELNGGATPDAQTLYEDMLRLLFNAVTNADEPRLHMDHLKIDSIKRLEEVTDFAIMALKVYVDKFFKFEKEAWEDQYLEYGELEATDNNFVDEYKIHLTEEVGGDYGKELERFIADADAILRSNKGLQEYQRSTLYNQFILFDFRHHLYAPLVCVKKNNLKIQVSPVQLNEEEKTFVDLLDCYMRNHAGEWKDKSLFLLRNKSKVGMGFFEAGNFYPDYILWIDTQEVQYISFIDPKGLLHFSPQDDKIKFYQKIKELEARLAPSATDKKIVLNSFIMSATKAAQLKQWWHMTAEEYEAMNVYTLDDNRCVAKMIEKIMLS